MPTDTNYKKELSEVLRTFWYLKLVLNSKPKTLTYTLNRYEKFLESVQSL